MYLKMFDRHPNWIHLQHAFQSLVVKPSVNRTGRWTPWNHRWIACGLWTKVAHGKQCTQSESVMCSDICKPYSPQVGWEVWQRFECRVHSKSRVNQVMITCVHLLAQHDIIFTSTAALQLRSPSQKSRCSRRSCDVHHTQDGLSTSDDVQSRWGRTLIRPGGFNSIWAQAVSPRRPGCSEVWWSSSGLVARMLRSFRCQEPLVASLLLVVRPGAPSSVLAPSSKARSP